MSLGLSSVFSLDTQFFQKTAAAPNGKIITWYTLTCFEENEFIQPEFGFRKVSFDVSLQTVSVENSGKNEALDAINADLNELQIFSSEEIRARLEERMQENYNAWGEHNFQYVLDETLDCVFADNEILTFSVYTTSYTGGAHGSYNTVYKNYSQKTGKNLGVVTDLIQNTDDEKLLALLRQKLLENDGGDRRVPDDFFEFDKIKLNDNFYPDKTGITFFYNIYEILPYVYGASAVSFSFEELSPFIAPESPFGYLFR